MRTIWYLINLARKSVVDTLEGVDDEPPPQGFELGDKHAAETGDTFVLARGKLFFQPECPSCPTLVGGDPIALLAELAPGEDQAAWPELCFKGQGLAWTGLSLRIHATRPDGGSPYHAFEQVACIRENSAVELRVDDSALLVIAACEVPSGRAQSARDVTLSGKAIKVRPGEKISARLLFDSKECKCEGPHDLVAHLSLSLHGTFEEAP